MKNLKKVLSLVLALAMALSLMTVAFAKDASDYADYSKVTYNEAVDVMTAIGVFDGMDGTNFAPDGTLTREQAAKIITYMLMGKENADQLTTTIAPYSDVSASRWSAGAIAYCTNAGILSGVGHGKFNPTDKLTGLQFAKMLLVALGYKADQENLTGESWSINAATLGIAAGLNEGMEDVKLNGYLTREQAAQMAFNAEKATMVAYSASTSVSTSDKVTVTVNGSRYNVTNNGATDGNIGAQADQLMQFAEKYCTELVATKPGDDFKNPATVWNYKGDEIGSYATKANKTYTAEVKLSDIAKTLPANIGTVSYYVDGVASNDNSNQAITVSNLNSNNANKIGGNGILTSVYYAYNATNKNYDVTITSVKTYASKVNTCEKNNDGKYDVVVDQGSAYKFESATAIAEDTVVLYTYANGKVQTMTTANSVTGDTTLVKTNTNGTVGEAFTMNGTNYEYSAQYNNADVNKLTANAKNLVAYLDPYGYVIYIDNAVIADNYAVVLAHSNAWSTSTTTEVQLLLSDGTVKKVEAKTSSFNKTDIDNNLVTYTVDSNGIYTLSDKGNNEQSGTVAVAATKGVSKFTIGANTYYANNNTVFFLNDGTNYKAYIGVANMPSLSGNVDMYNVEGAANSVVKAVYLKSSNSIETGTAGEKAAFIYKTGTEKWYVTSDNDAYYTMNAVVDGKAATLDVNGTAYAALTTTNLVKSLSVDANNRVTNYTLVTGAANTVTGNVDAAAKDGVIKIAGVNYTYASNVVCFVYDQSDAAFTAKSITSLKDGNNATIQLDNGVIVAIYYVQA